MHNDIMAAGSKDRPPMLATGRYAQVLVPAKPATKTYPPAPEHTVQETYKNMLPENCAYIDAEAKAIHMILSGIGDEIYSIIDACKTAKEMWIAIERLQQGKEVAKSITPPSLSATEEDSDPEQAQRDKDIQKSIALIAKKTVGNQVVHKTGIHCFNCKEYGHLAKECMKLKQDIDEEPDEQELEAHYMYMEKIQEVLHVTDDNFKPTYDTEPLEQIVQIILFIIDSGCTKHDEQS
ncbi:integrase, catalytic region, zinc finger, CCHC-type containing protein [Tanacetum coccineum]